jgi:hypothetical protein
MQRSLADAGALRNLAHTGPADFLASKDLLGCADDYLTGEDHFLGN